MRNPSDACQLGRRVGDDRAIQVEHAFRFFGTPRDGAADDVGTDLVQLVFEAGDDTEVAAAAAQSPEEIAVLVFRRAHDRAVGGDEIHRCDVVRRPAEPPGEISEAAAKRQAGAAGVRDESEDRGQAMKLCLAIDIAEEAPGLRAREPRRRVDPHAAHQRHVEHQAVLAHGKPGDVVAAALDRERQPVLARRANAGDDVGGTEAANDDGGAPVDHRVPQRTRIVIAGISGAQNGTAHAAPQFLRQRLMLVGRCRRRHIVSSCR